MRRRWILALFCLLAVPTVGAAQALEDYDYENLSFRGIGLEYGRIWPNKVEPAATYTLKVDLGFLGPALRVMPSFTYWSSTLEAGELERFAQQLNRLPGADVDPADLGAIDWSSSSIALDAQVVWAPIERVQGYVGTGVGLHVFNGSGPSIEGTFIEDLLDSITAGLNGLVGVEFAPADRFRLHLEGRYTLLDNLRYPEVRIGGAFTLPASTPVSAHR